MRQKIILVFLAISLLLLSVMVGCGTLDVNLHTTVKSSGDLVQQIRLEGSGMMGNLLDDSEFTEELEQGGWTITTERSEDSVSVTSTKNFRWDEPIIFDEESILEDVSYRVSNRILVKDYFFEATLPGEGPVGTMFEGEEGEFEELGGVLLEDMLNISWTVTLPGNIVESNADTFEGDSAIWYFDIEPLEGDRYLTAYSRETNWAVIGGIIAAVLVVLALVIYLLVRRKTTWAPFQSEVIQISENKEES